MIISSEWSLVWGLACVVFALILSHFLYKRSVLKDSERLRKVLFFLRFSVVLILSFFLLKPYIIQNKLSKERPIVNIGVDNSTSMLANADSLLVRQNIQQKIDKLTEELSEKYQVQVFAFGESVQRTNRFDFSHKKTDIHAFFNELSDFYKNRNVAANIILSDGIYNSSINPVYANYSFDGPLYTLMVGDTSQKKDLQIANISCNDISYLGNTFPLKVGVMAQNCQQENVAVTIWNEGVKLAEQTETVNEENELLLFDFKLSSMHVGVQKYDVKVAFLQNESNIQNNQQATYIDVLESKEKLLLISDKTHPDIRAVTEAIETNENYELTQLSLSEFDGNYSPYSLVIFFHTKDANIEIPSLYFVGNQLPAGFVDWVSLTNSQSTNEIEAIYAPFSLFTLNEDWKKWILQLPPVYSHHSRISFNSQHSDLFYQRLMGIETNRPIFSFGKVNGQRQGICFVEGLWKWRLFEYSTNKNHQYFDELINKSIQYLSVKEDKRPLRLKYENILSENNLLSIQAEFYNSNYELITDSDISLVISDENGKDYTYTFNKKETSYFLEVDNLKNGDYNLLAKTNFNGNEFIYNGQFSVKPLDIEKMNTKANHQSLYSLSKKYNGKSYYLSQESQLLNELNTIKASTISYATKSKSDLINLKWISFLLFVFLTIEWFIRKRITNI